MNDLIKKLVELYGPSGFEDQIREVVRQEVAPYVDEISVDPMGNLIAHKRGTGENGRKVMIAAHLDEIGVMVTHITEQGYLRFTNIGGVFPQTLLGGRVLFADGTIGIVHSERLKDRSQIHGLDKHFIDVGASSREDCPIEVGTAAGFYRPFTARGERLTAKSMDDRIGCVVMIEALKQLEETPHEVYFVFTVQEEVGTRGAMAVAKAIDPDIGLAIDVTPAFDYPETEKGGITLGGGTAIKVKDSGMISHAGLVRLMRQRAEEADIPYQLEVLLRGGTDARSIQIANGGVIAGCISIPCRYVHTPSETVDAGDVTASVDLLLELLRKPLDL